jgi:RNA polymerase nonessential primary-like sigma factor
LPADRLDGECLKGDLRALLEQLPELQCRVLKMRYGIDNDGSGLLEPMSLSSIAKTLGMSRDKTRNLERKALEGIRSHSRRLDGYLAA